MKYLLLDYGMNPNNKDHQGRTPLDVALEAGAVSDITDSIKVSYITQRVFLALATSSPLNPLCRLLRELEVAPGRLSTLPIQAMGERAQLKRRRP